MTRRNRTLLLLTALAALLVAAGPAAAKDKIKIKEKSVVTPGDDETVAVWIDTDGKSFHGERMAFFGRTDGAYLGIHMQNLGEQLAAYFEAEGVLVESVFDDSPAAASGLEAGDVITRLDDEPIEDTADVSAFMAEREPGDEIRVKVKRKGKDKSFDVTLAEREDHGRIQALLDDDAFPHARMLRDFHAAPHAPRGFRFRGPGDEEAREELENLKADVAELKAMLEELQEKK